MKVVMICTEKLPVPPVRGGAIQTYIAGIADTLGKHHDLTILGTSDPTLAMDERVRNVRYARVNGHGVFEIYAQEVLAFLRANAYDVIHVFNRPRLVPLIREVCPNARIVLSMHNDMFDAAKIPPAEAASAIANTSTIITISDYVGRVLASLYRKRKGNCARSIPVSIYRRSSRGRARRLHEKFARSCGLPTTSGTGRSFCSSAD